MHIVQPYPNPLARSVRLQGPSSVSTRPEKTESILAMYSIDRVNGSAGCICSSSTRTGWDGLTAKNFSTYLLHGSEFNRLDHEYRSLLACCPKQLQGIHFKGVCGSRM